MFGPVRRMERRRGFVVGMAVGAAASRPRTVVYGYPSYPVGYCTAPTVQVIATPPVPPPTTTQIIVNQSEEKYPLSYQQAPLPATAAAYQQAPAAAAYPQAPPPYQQAPPYQQQPAYNPACVPPYTPVAAPVEIVKKPELPPRDMERRYFLLINEANCQVLQVEHGIAHKATKLVIEKRRVERVSIQRWYVDKNGYIRCALNDYALESKDGGDKIYTVPYDGEPRQQWILKDNRIINRMMTSDCVGLKKRLFLSDDADVIVSRYDNKPYQHWRIEYV